MIKIDFLDKIKNFFLRENNINDNLEKIEEILLEADISVQLVEEILNRLKNKNITKFEDFITELKEEILTILTIDNSIIYNDNEINVLLMFGVNGAGKTTTCAKLARIFLNKNKKVLLVGADTFRAAAIEQLEKFANNIKADFISGKNGSDPASVVFDSITKARKSKVNFLIIDTAGRLHNKYNLMQELLKIQKVILKELERKNLFSFVVLDANTGKNMINQVKEFNEKLGLTGIILTKFDSASKAGSLLSILNELKTPVKYITYGEKIEDISEFSPQIFIDKFFR